MKEGKPVSLNITYTDEEAIASAEFPRLGDGWYMLIVTQANRGRAFDRDQAVRMRLRALKDPTNSDSAVGPPVFGDIVSPFKENPDDEQPSGRSANMWLAAMYPKEVLREPTKEGEQLIFRGKPCQSSMRNSCRQEAYKSSAKKFADLWCTDQDNVGSPSDPLADLISQVVVAKIENKTSKAGNTSMRVTDVCAELPAGEELICGDELRFGSSEFTKTVDSSTATKSKARARRR